MSAARPARPPRDGRSVRWDQHRRDRRRDLVRAAREAVHELGPQASMDEIAARAGTSKSVYYRYFGDRAGLRAAVAESVTAYLERRLLEAADATEDGPAALHGMVRVCLALAAASPHVYAFAVDSRESDEGPAPALTPFFERVAEVLRQGMDRALADAGREVPAGSPLPLWPRAAVGLVRSAVEAWLALPEARRPDPETTAAALADWMLHGVLVEATPGRVPVGAVEGTR